MEKELWEIIVQNTFVEVVAEFGSVRSRVFGTLAKSHGVYVANGKGGSTRFSLANVRSITPSENFTTIRL